MESACGQGKTTVLIWDVDETLVLFLSLLDGSFAQAFGMQVSSYCNYYCAYRLTMLVRFVIHLPFYWV